jgi:uncharacterized membrane protein SirB2
LAEYYLQIRNLHIACAMLSIALFVFRGGLMLTGSPLLRTSVLRYAPHLVDTVLLVSALMLTTIIRQYPFVQGWLTLKVLLLVAYVVLGSLALKRGRTRRTRVLALVTALATVLFLFSVARAHDPLGLFAAG